MAASILSFGIFTALALLTAVLSLELDSMCGPPSLTAMAISLPIRVNCTAILAHLLNFRSLRNSNALPIFILYLITFLPPFCLGQMLVSNPNPFVLLNHQYSQANYRLWPVWGHSLYKLT